MGFYDGFQNLITRIGAFMGGRAAGDTYALDIPSRAEIDAAYRTSLFRKIVDIPPFDMTREWRDWQAEKEQIAAIEDTERRLNVAVAIRRGLSLARLYGGAALVIGVRNAGAPSQPLDPERVTQDSLDYVHVFNRYQISADTLDRDPASPGFGAPTRYSINGSLTGQVFIHPSRVVRFLGPDIPDEATAPDGWGDSLYTSLHRAMKNADGALEGMAALLSEAKIDVIKVPDLMSNLGSKEYEDRMTNRIRLAMAQKSLTNYLLMDSNEEFEQRELSSFAGMAETVRLFLAVLSGAADIPATRLFGKSPDGMNATGDNDLRNYYDMLKSRQALEIRPALAILDECIIRSALGNRPEEIVYEFGPLWQMTPAEKADVDKKNADTAAVYANSGLVPDTALAKGVQNKLIEDGVFPGIEQALADAEAAGELSPLEEGPSPEELALAAAQGAAANENAAPPQGKPGTAKAVGDALLMTDAAPRSLYVRRNVVNAADIVAWAKSQGFKSVVPADQMHVTIAFSRTPIDWMTIGRDWTEDEQGRIIVRPGGPRVVERLGPHEAPVLMFGSSDLRWRWRSIKDAGAAWEYGDDYQPHVTISYDGQSIDDPAAVEPYRGPIVLGPEIFEEVNDDWKATFKEE